MGLVSNIKKSAKTFAKSTLSPYNFVVPFVGGLVSTIRSEHIDRKEEKQASEAEAEAVAAANNEFNENLERRRKNSAQSGVIYAGILGDNKKVGLGGKKSLLGL